MSRERKQPGHDRVSILILRVPNPRMFQLSDIENEATASRAHDAPVVVAIGLLAKQEPRIVKDELGIATVIHEWLVYSKHEGGFDRTCARAAADSSGSA
jgi:hypothetical protein